MHPRFTTAGSVTLMLAALGLGGCSPDGGFFPGGMSHNEGAIDYRVASLHGCDDDGFVSLGVGAGGERQPLAKPYVALGKTDSLRTISRTRVPESLQQAFEVSVARKTDLRAATEALTLKRANNKSLQDSIAPASKALEEADARVTRIEKEIAQLGNADYLKVNNIDPDKAPDMIKEKQAGLDGAKTAAADAKARLKVLNESFEKATKEAGDLDIARNKAAEDAKAAEDNYSTINANYIKGVNAGTIERETFQTVRVTLKQAYLREFNEGGPVGEVAILMTVKESRTGLGQQEPRAGRVVYYSEGARMNAFMNFRDQPVYGPISYNGDDLQIRVSIIELDESDNAVSGAVLKTLATIGSVAYPPSSPVLAALDQIGSSLLTLNGPDLEWDYLMRLSARPITQAGTTSNWDCSYDAWIRDGYYVLMRSDCTDGDRRARIDQSTWDSLELDIESGVIYKRLADKSDGAKNVVREPYTDRSYLVFALQTGLDSSHLDLAQEAADLSAVVSAYGSGAQSLGNASETLAKELANSLEKIKQSKLQRRTLRTTQETK